MSEQKDSRVLLWRLPVSGRLHASKKCELLELERTLPSPMQHQLSLLHSMTGRRTNNYPQQSYWTIEPGLFSRLCSCASHLRK
jgi:hypothetical protein